MHAHRMLQRVRTTGAGATALAWWIRRAPLGVGAVLALSTSLAAQGACAMPGANACRHANCC